MLEWMLETHTWQFSLQGDETTFTYNGNFSKVWSVWIGLPLKVQALVLQAGFGPLLSTFPENVDEPTSSRCDRRSMQALIVKKKATEWNKTPLSSLKTSFVPLSWKVQKQHACLYEDVTPVRSFARVITVHTWLKSREKAQNIQTQLT